METKFNIYSGILRAYERDNKKRFHTVASSSVKDLHGDVIHLPALERMARDAVGMTLFLNHAYNVPEDIMGTAEDAQLVQRGTDGDGSPIYDLDLDGIVNETNPRAVKTWDAINSGVKLGTSIGALIPQPDGAKKNKTGAWDIYDIQLLEASIVAIPANPRSWVQYAAKSLRAAEMLNDAGITTTFGASGLTTSVTVGGIYPDLVVPHIGNALGVSEDGEIIEAAPCPDCGGSAGKPKGDCTNAMHKDIEPDVLANTTVVNITVNNDDAQGAVSSEPENAIALMDEDRADVSVEPDQSVLGDTATSSGADVIVMTEFDPSHPEQIGLRADALGELVTALHTALSRVETAEMALKTATAERDEWKHNWDQAAEIIARIENLPIGRKTAFAHAVNDFRTKFDGYYSEEFLKFMEK